MSREIEAVQGSELPCNIGAEQSVIGALMLNAGALTRVADWLSEEDFYRLDHQLIYRAIRALIERNSPVDALTLGDWFESNGLGDKVDRRYLLSMSDETTSPANIVAYAEIVVERSRLRALIDTGERMGAQARQNGADAQRIVAETMHGLAGMQTTKLRGGLMAAKAILQDVYTERMKRLEDGHKGMLLGMPTPWLGINRATRGLRDGVLYIVASRPNMGKSVLGVQLSSFCAIRGNRTALFSVEMTGEECMTRAVACVGEIEHRWVEDPHYETDLADVYNSRHTAAYRHLLDSELLIDATPGLTIAQLTARARRAHMQKPLRLIVVDHMHDMGIDPKREARFELGLIAQGAKSLAKEFNCPVVLLGQLNRANTSRPDKRPTMADLRESGEIEQKADVIILLHREDYYNANTPNKGVVEAIIAKGRNIKTGEIVYLENRFSEMRLSDWEGPAPISAQSTHGKGAGLNRGLRPRTSDYRPASTDDE